MMPTLPTVERQSLAGRIKRCCLRAAFAIVVCLVLYEIVSVVWTTFTPQSVVDRAKSTGDVDKLISLLGNADAEMRWRAANAVADLNAARALPELRNVVNDSDGFVRVHALIAIWRIEHRLGNVLPLLIESRSDESAGVRRLAVSAIGQIGEKSDGAEAAVLSSLDDRDADVRIAAAAALARIKPSSEVAVPALIRMLNDDVAAARRGAVASLAHFGRDAGVAEPKLRAMLDQSDSRMQWEINQALQRISQ